MEAIRHLKPGAKHALLPFYFTARLTGSFLIGIQFPSSLISLATLFLGYATARLYFTRTLAWTLVALMAFDEWDLLLSLSNEAGVLLLFWEWLVLYLLGRLIFTPHPVSRRPWACALGLALGAGPYTFMAWPVLTLLVLGITLEWFWKNRDPIGSGLFLFSLLAAIIPFLAAARKEGYGGHLRDVAAWNDPSFSWFGQMGNAVGYFQAIFWGGTGGLRMAPEGGFLNVILGSFFILGFLEVCRFRGSWMSRLLLIFLPIFLLPGIFSTGLEAYRILLILSFLLVVVAIGVRSLVFSFQERFRLVLLVGLLGASAFLDLNRLFHPGDIFFHPPASAGDTNEYRSSFRVLSAQARGQGPGWIFSDMLANTLDYSLAYCSYPFNAAWNPRLSGDVKWAAVFTESRYLPFLVKTFPSSRWRVPPIPQTGMPGRHALGLIEVTPGNLSRLEGWKDYYRFQQEINLETADIPTGETHQPILEKLLRGYPHIPEDPFLQSCFFGKLAYNYSWEKTFGPVGNHILWTYFYPVFRGSFEKSYQDAELCEKYGRLLALENNKAEARIVFKKALELSPGNPWLEDEIRQLGLGD